ncbi:MAG TPA: RHS repeat-associated core domain-containing protein [Steroidobacteraceae bacterium]|nr:RHS repeat-associated core domain-containing protein [Steroidobacteraceae bacterium]
MNKKILWLAGLLPLCAAAAVPPTINLLSAAPVPLNIISNTSSYPTARSPNGDIAWTQLPPEMKALARTLGADHYAAGRITAAEYAQNVYDYVHNNIDTEFRFGLSKGGRGALIDQSGTPFDQAELMVKLIRSAGIAASYQVGNITLTENDFGRWTGLVRNVVESTQTVDVDARSACQFLADGGIPTSLATDCTTLTGDVGTVTLVHVWVTAAGKAFDPSFKLYTIHQGLTDLTTRLGCATTACGSGSVTAALTGADTANKYGFPAIKSLNETQLSTYLTARSTALANSLKTDNRLASIPQVVSGKRLLDPVSVAAPTSLSYASAPVLTWSGEIPDSFRTKLRVRFGPDRTFFVDELAGRRLQLSDQMPAPDALGFYIDGTDGTAYQQLVSPNNCTTCVDGYLLLDIDHPYAANSNTYADEHRELTLGATYSQSNGFRNPFPITVLYGFGAGSASTEKHFSALQEAQVANEYAKWMGFDGINHYQIYRSADHVIPAAKLRHQGAAADRIISGLAHAQINRHHDIGLVSSDVNNPGSAFTMSLVSGLSVTPDVSTADGLDRRNMAFRTSAAAWAMLEGSVNQEIDRSDVGLSMAYLFHFGNSVVPVANRYAFLDLTQTQMQNSTFSGITSFNTIYKAALNQAGAAGYGGIITDRVNSGELFNKTGSTGSTIAAIIKGGAGVSTDPIGKAVDSAKVVDAAAARKKYLAVSPADGGVTLTQSDLVTGEGGFPSSLSLTRVYKSDVSVSEEIIEGWSNADTDADSQMNPRSYRYSGPDSTATSRIGGGWTHNFNVILTLSGNGPRGLGEDSAVEGASAIAALWTMFDQQRSTAFSSRLTSVFTSYWLGSKLAFNSANVDKGGASETLIKLADDSFFNMRGESRLVQSGAPSGSNYVSVTFTYTGAGGDTIAFDWMKARHYPRYSDSPAAIVDPVFKATNWNFPDGQSVTFNYTGQFLVGSWQGTPKATSCPDPLAPCTGDPIDMTLPYGFVLQSVTNNKGRSLTFTTETVNVRMSGKTRDVFDSFGTNQYRITRVTADDGRAVNYTLADCPVIGNSSDVLPFQPARAMCDKLTVRAPDNSETVYTYNAATDSPNPAVKQRTEYRLRRWYASISPPPATPFRVVKYDEIFRALSVTDPLNHSAFYYPGGVTGTERWKRAETVSTLGFVSRGVFDEKNSSILSRDALGRESRSTYDNAGRMTRTIYPEGNAETRAYDVRSNVTQTCQLSKTRGTQACAVASGDLVSDVQFVEGPTVTTCVNPASCNKPYLETNARRYVTRNTWNNTTGLLERIEPGLNSALTCALSGGVCPQTDVAYLTLSGSTIRAIDTVTKKISSTSNLVSKITYNSSNHWVPQTGTVDYGAGAGFLNSATTLTFDAAGNVTQVDGSRSTVSDIRNFTWDQQRRLTTAIEADPDGAGSLARPAVRTVYDADGLVTFSYRGTTTNSTGSDFVAAETTAYLYDAAGNKTRQTTPSGVQQMSYDDDDRPLCTAVRMNPAVYNSLPASACTLGTEGTMGPDRITKFNYDAAGQILSEQRSLGTVWQQNYYTATYTPNGKQDWVEDANGNRTEFVYDDFDRLCRMFFPSATLGAHVANVGTGAPSTLNCSFSPTSADYEQYGYDVNGNRTSIVKRRGSGTVANNTITFGYDEIDREILKDIPGGTSADVYTGYDLLNRKLYAHFASIGSVSSTCTGGTAPNGMDYCYDRAGRLTAERRDARTLNYVYDIAGNRTKVSWPGVTDTVAYTYDAMNRMKVICENGAVSTAGDADCSTTPLVTYNYDSLGRRGTIVRANNTTTTFGYDGASRLSSVQQDVVTNSFDVTFGLPSYNPASQALQRTINTTSYVFNQPVATASYVPNGLNRYASYTAPGTSTAATFGYDARGNFTSDGASSNLREFGYDIENRMTSASVSGANALTLSYDPVGRLKQIVAGANTTQMLYDGDRLTAEYNGSATAPLRRYVHGSSVDEPVVWYEGSGITDKRWFHTDHQGSVVALSDSTGAVTSATQYTYDAYGVPNAWPGSRFRYTGQIALNDATNVKLYYYKARVYDPTIGRFIQTDPVGTKDDQNLYAYVGNDPTNSTDPEGTTTWFWGGAGNDDDAEYKADFVEAMDEAGVQDANAVPEAATSPGGITADLVLLPNVNNVTAANIVTPGVQPGGVGQQYNLVGYSYGSVLAAQQALSESDKGVQVDNLVLIGPPINQDLMDAVMSSPNIANVIVQNIAGDPVHAGMTDGQLAAASPTLAYQMIMGTGHFTYAGADAGAAQRRRELVSELVKKGVR